MSRRYLGPVAPHGLATPAVLGYDEVGVPCDAATLDVAPAHGLATPAVLGYDEVGVPCDAATMDVAPAHGLATPAVNPSGETSPGGAIMDWLQYRRTTTRLDCWDYSQGAYYYITICTKDQHPHFGNVHDGVMHLSPIGKHAKACLDAIHDHFPHVELDYSIVMPNHLHAILIFDNSPSAKETTIPGPNPIPIPKGGSLGHVLSCYKATVTKWCRENGNPNFSWQPRFYDHIIRNEKSLYLIRKYIENNPLQWELERESPESIGDFL